MSTFFKKLNVYFIITLLLITVFLIFQFIYIKWDIEPSGTDGHLARCLLYYDQIIMGKDNDLVMIPFPPLTYIASVPFFFFNEISLESARLTLIIFAFIFLASMYGIGKALGDQYSGLITVAIAASSPAVLDLSKKYFLDFPQTAMTALAFYMLIKADGFRDKKYSILLGITLALSFLTKWSTAFFLAFPVLWVCFSVFSEARRNTKRFILLLGFVLVMFLLTVFYYSIVKPLGGGIERYWYIFYIIAVIIPSVIWYMLNNRMIQSQENYEKTPVKTQETIVDQSKNPQEDHPCSSCERPKKEQAKPCRITNFGLYLISFASLSATYYFWAAGTMIHKFQGEKIADHRVLSDNINTLSNYFVNGMNFFPLFQIFSVIGILLLLVKFKEFYTKSFVCFLIPLNIIFISLLMWQIGFEDYRYYLSIVIFMTAFAGFWTYRLKKLRLPVLAVVLIISFFSITEWMIMPNIENHQIRQYHDQGLFNLMGQQRKIPLFKIIGKQFPVVTSIHMEALGSSLSEGISRPWEVALTFIYPGFNPELIELIPIYTYKEGRGINPRWIDWVDYYVQKKFYKESLSSLFDPWMVSDKLAVRLKKADDDAAKAVYFRLSYETSNLLAAHKEGTKPSEALQKSLAEDLNKLLFMTVPLDQLLPINIEEHSELSHIKEKNPRGESMIILNRAILELVFEQELDTGFDLMRVINQLDRVGNVLIVRRAQQNPEETIKEVERIFPGVQYKRRDFAVKDNYVVTHLRLKRQGIFSFAD